MLTRWPWLTPFLVLAVALGAVLLLRPVTYQASTTLAVQEQVDAESVAGSVSVQRARTEAARMQAGQQLVEQVQLSTDVVPPAGDLVAGAADRVRLQVNHPDPRFAQALADSLAAAVAAEHGNVVVADLAELPTRPSGPHPALLLAGGLALAWLLALGVAALARRGPS